MSNFTVSKAVMKERFMVALFNHSAHLYVRTRFPKIRVYPLTLDEMDTVTCLANRIRNRSTYK